MNKEAVKQLHYAAPYDHEAALQLAYEYLSGKNVARNKYLAFTYYKLFKELEAIHPKPLCSVESEKLDTTLLSVVSQLKSELYLSDNFSTSGKTILRNTINTKNYRELHSWFAQFQGTANKLHSFFALFNLNVLGSIFGRIPLLSSFLLATEITFEVGIVTKNGLKRAFHDYQNGEGFSFHNISNDMSLSLKKDNRRSRLFSAIVWLAISLVAISISLFAAPLVVIGTTADVIVQTFTGLRDIFALRKERDFLKAELELCQQQLPDHSANYQSVTQLLHSGKLPNIQLPVNKLAWLFAKEQRLMKRLAQINATTSLEKIKLSANVSMTSIILLGASIALIPTPASQVFGIFTMAVGAIGVLSLKIIEKCLDSDYKTQSAVSAAEMAPTTADSTLKPAVENNMVNDVASLPDNKNMATEHCGATPVSEQSFLTKKDSSAVANHGKPCPQTSLHRLTGLTQH